jgi:hypothetical protein
MDMNIDFLKGYRFALQYNNKTGSTASKLHKEYRRIDKWLEVLEDGNIEYVKLAGKNRMILRKEKKANKTFLCAFCGNTHSHALAEGHRTPHCAGFHFEKIFASDGTPLYQSDGYVIKNV